MEVHIYSINTYIVLTLRVKYVKAGRKSTRDLKNLCTLQENSAEDLRFRRQHC